MSEIATSTVAGNIQRYEALMDVIRNRMTNRAFAPCDVPREHFEKCASETGLSRV